MKFGVDVEPTFNWIKAEEILMSLLKRFIAWFTGAQGPRSLDETSPVEEAPSVDEAPLSEADESPASPSSASTPSRAFSIWTESETLKVNPISKTGGK